MPLRLLSFPISMLLFAGAVSAQDSQERIWTLDASDEDAYLVFGVPETDDLGISLWCPIGQGKVNIFVPETGEKMEAGKDVTITLKAGDETTEVKAKTDVNAEAGVSSAEGSIAADDPIFNAMMKTDRFRVSVGTDELIFPLFDVDVAGLLELCRKQ